MVKIPFKLCVAGALAFLAALAAADTVFLRNGEKVEGKILSETDAGTTVQIQVTPTIKDERFIKAADIRRVEKVSPDELAWPALSAMALGPESLEISEYRRAATLLGDFIVNFSASKHAPAAKEKLVAFEAEAKRVEAGEIKLAGQWLSKEEVERENVQIVGRVLFSRMQRFATAGQFVEAMNTFAALEKEAGGSAAYPDALDLKRQILPALKTAAEQRKVQVKAQAEENKRRLENVTGTERQVVERLQKQQAEAVAAALSAHERGGMPWPPLNPATEQSIGSLLSKVTSEMNKAVPAPTAKMRSSISLAESARAALAAKNIEKADKDITAAKSAWAGNELVKRLQPEIAEARRKFMEEKRAADARASAAAAKAARPKAPTPTPVPAPVSVVNVEQPKSGTPLLSQPLFWAGMVVLIGIILSILKNTARPPAPAENHPDR